MADEHLFPRLTEDIKAAFRECNEWRASAAENKWYVAAMNDCIFIISRKPHPAPVDYVNPNTPAPSVVISMRSGSREAEELASQIVNAHNAAIRGHK